MITRPAASHLCLDPAARIAEPSFA